MTENRFWIPTNLWFARSPGLIYIPRVVYARSANNSAISRVHNFGRVLGHAFKPSAIKRTAHLSDTCRRYISIGNDAVSLDGNNWQMDEEVPPLGPLTVLKHIHDDRMCVVDGDCITL